MSASSVRQRLLPRRNRSSAPPDGRRSPRALLQSVSRVKCGSSLEEAQLDQDLYDAYRDRLRALGALDFDDLLSEGLKVDTAGQRRFTHLLVDEFQDVKPNSV